MRTSIVRTGRRPALVDTNVLLRLFATEDPFHAASQESVATALAEGPLYVASQNLVEFWNVSTRPTHRNGFGRSVPQARRVLAVIATLCRLLEERADVFSRWLDLVTRYEVRGVQVHDARLVAVMLSHSIETILTFNADDFRRFEPEGIRVVDPRSA